MSTPTKLFTKRPKLIAVVITAVSLLLYIIGVEFPLVLISAACLAFFLPMPRVINSWFSRLILSLFFLYSLLQIAAVLQFVIHPGGRFKLIAFLFTLITVTLVLIFGRLPASVKLINFKDIFALTGCLFFVLPFLPILTGNNSVNRIAKLSSTQITDSLTHYGTITNMSVKQNLDYSPGKYYPHGFHIATAFVEKSFLNIGSMSWKSQVIVYFLQYIFWGVLLCYMLIYACYSLLFLWAKKIPDNISLISLSLAVGICTTIMHLLLFMNEGFLNYYYICAAVLAALLYVFDAGITEKKSTPTSYSLAWPLTAYLLITAGVSQSWTLMTPPILMTFLLWALLYRSRLSESIRSVLNPITIILAALLAIHLLAWYFQLHYLQNGQSLLNAEGALHSFNPIFLAVGVIIQSTLLVWRKTDKSINNRLGAAVLPYLGMVALLATLQYFQTGQAKYYLIKTALFVEMLILITLAAAIALAVQEAGIDRVLRLIWVPAAVLFLVIVTIGTQAQPLQEDRELFRDYSKVGTPPFLNSDAYFVTKLGSANKIAHFNMTVLHYDSSGNRLYSHIETALWAHSMVPITLSDSTDFTKISGAKSQTCFGRQFANIAYEPESANQQQDIIKAVEECVNISKAHKVPFYLITDFGSVPSLQQIFGKQIVYVY